MTGKAYLLPLDVVYAIVKSAKVQNYRLCMKYEIPQMLKQGGGAIVSTASVAGLVGLAGRSAYVASKHGVVGITRTAALEYAQQGIRVNCVCPGYIRTPMVEYVVQHEGAQLEQRMVA